MLCFKKTKIKIRYWLAVLLAMIFFLWCDFNSASADDLLWQLVEPAYEEQIIIGIWKSKEVVWDTVMKWVTEFWAGVSLWIRRVIGLIHGLKHIWFYIDLYIQGEFASVVPASAGR